MKKFKERCPICKKRYGTKQCNKRTKHHIYHKFDRKKMKAGDPRQAMCVFLCRACHTDLHKNNLPSGVNPLMEVYDDIACG